LKRYASGDTWDDYHAVPTIDLAMAWLAVSAGTGHLASAEALFSIAAAFSTSIPNDQYLRLGGSIALNKGMEFILKEVLIHDIPRKDEFLEVFRIRHCRGVGILLTIPKSASMELDQSTIHSGLVHLLVE